MNKLYAYSIIAIGLAPAALAIGPSRLTPRFPEDASPASVIRPAANNALASTPNTDPASSTPGPTRNSKAAHDANVPDQTETITTTEASGVTTIVTTVTTKDASGQPKIKRTEKTTTPSTQVTVTTTTDAQGNTVTERTEKTIPGAAPEAAEASTTLSGATLAFSDKLQLVTASIFTGGFKIRENYEMNTIFTSTLPAAKKDDADKNRYQDAELLLPHGGVINLLVSPFVTATAGSYETYKNSPYGRGELSDRRYFGLKDVIKDKATKFYSSMGLGPRVLSRNNDGAKDAVDSYGVAATAYAGLGFDGGLDEKDKEGVGNFRFEVYGIGNWTDRATMRALYPGAGIGRATYGIGANLNINISQRMMASVQWAAPRGPGKDHMREVLLVSLSIATKK